MKAGQNCQEENYNRKIRLLEENFQVFKVQKCKFSGTEKKLKGEIRILKRANKKLYMRLIAKERKAEECEEQIQFEVKTSKDITDKSI